MHTRLLSAVVASALGAHVARAQVSSPPVLPVEILRPVAALPAHLAGAFRDIAACHHTPEGDYLVFDRGSHAVSVVPQNGPPREIVQIGVEAGRLLRPLAFDSASDGTFVIADAPFRAERVQIFFYGGGAIGAFTLAGRSTPRVTLGDAVLSGVGSLTFTGKTILVSQPDSGALVSEYSLDGRVLRSFGELRATAHEDERDIHLALNSGLPLTLRDGSGFYFVFLAGAPMFRRYDPGGRLVFERHIEGVQLDQHIQALPRKWPPRRTAEGEFPIVPASIRTAAVDADGRLWVSLATGHTYVYDVAGDKRRVLQFHGAGALSPLDLYFTRGGRLIVSPGCYTFEPRKSG